MQRGGERSDKQHGTPGAHIDVLVVIAVLLAELGARLAVDEARLAAVADDVVEPDRLVLLAAAVEVDISSEGEAQLSAGDCRAVVIFIEFVVADSAPDAGVEDLDAAAPERAAGAADAVDEAQRVGRAGLGVVARAVCEAENDTDAGVRRPLFSSCSAAERAARRQALAGAPEATVWVHATMTLLPA